MAFFTATAKQAGYVLALIAVVGIVLALIAYFRNEVDMVTLAISIIIELIIIAAGIGITKHSSKAYYLGLIFIILGFISAIIEIFMAAGVLSFEGVPKCGWITAICDIIVTGIMLGVLCFNKKEILN